MVKLVLTLTFCLMFPLSGNAEDVTVKACYEDSDHPCPTDKEHNRWFDIEKEKDRVIINLIDHLQPAPKDRGSSILVKDDNSVDNLGR